MTSADDPEQRIADLEKQVADAKRIAELERQLADARAQQIPSFDTDGFDAPSAPRPPVDTRLADAPRRIPPNFLLAELLPFRWWYVFAIFMVTVTPIALWIAIPVAVAPAAVALILLIYGYQFSAARKRLSLVKWGRVADVTGTEELSRGTYYSGTTYSNVFLPHAHGWTVSRELWSGASVKTRVHYAIDGNQGALVLRGRAYEDGVVLADPRKPQRALCVSSFPYDLNRDEMGNWVGRLRPRLLIGMMVWMIIVIAWLTAAFAISTGISNELFATRLDHGGHGAVSSNDTVYCNDGHLDVDGIDTVVTVHGHCASLSVSGIDDVVTVDSADTITLSGIDNSVVYHTGDPDIVNDSSGKVSRG